MPDINFPQAGSAARRPRGLVRINGEVMRGWIEWEVDSNAFYEADTFSCVFSLSLLPPTRPARWWSEQASVTVEILAGFPDDPEDFQPTELDLLILGEADTVDLDPVGRTITIRGRDRTALLIDNKTSDRWPNNTASDIVRTIAERRGLIPVVTPTTTKVGTYYQIDHVQPSDKRSEWDLLAYLANEEDFRVFVRGNMLHFGPHPDDKASTYVLLWQPPDDERAYPVFNGTELKLSRSTTVARDIIVQVRSWNSKAKRGYTVSYPKQKSEGIQAGTSGVGQPRIYRYTVPNLLPDQAVAKAQAMHRSITQHEMRMSASLPADNLLWPEKLMEIRGTDTAFDQTYYPETIVRTMSKAGGYRMSITGKNVSPEVEAAT